MSFAVGDIVRRHNGEIWIVGGIIVAGGCRIVDSADAGDLIQLGTSTTAATLEFDLVKPAALVDIGKFNAQTSFGSTAPHDDSLEHAAAYYVRARHPLHQGNSPTPCAHTPA